MPRRTYTSPESTRDENVVLNAYPRCSSPVSPACKLAPVAVVSAVEAGRVDGDLSRARPPSCTSMTPGMRNRFESSHPVRP
eukprot:4194695-Pleurochrysis_carterae.AAC.2